jgi:hypothetical protein
MTEDEQDSDAPGALTGYSEIDALLDGEAVDRNALRSALDDSAARDYLLDALLLRQLTRDMGPARFAAIGTPRGSPLGAARWIAAGLILVVGASVGYVQGQRSKRPLASRGSVEVVLDNTPRPAPEPTTLIRFEPGVNWTSDNRSR